MLFQRLAIFSILLKAIMAAAATTPVWQTTGYVQSAAHRIINGDACSCTIGNGSAPIVLMSFVGSFPSVPYYAYGVSRYEGSDFLGSQMYEVIRTGITNRDITIQARVLGISRIWVLEVRYIVISRSFPHLINTFDNVPVNLSSGAITNISTYSLTTKTYTNSINFNSQSTATGSIYGFFSLPLSNNKIVLFPTSLHLFGTEQPITATTFNPIKLYITATPVTTTTYTISVKLGINVTITKLHFSIVIYDAMNIFSSNNYKMINEKVCYPVTGGNYVFPPQFQNSFMGAFVEFSTTRTTSVIHFRLNVDSSGATMPLSVPRDITMTTLSRFCYNLLYLKSWFCPGGRTYDPVIDMCSHCPGIPGCLDCLNATFCNTCATSLNYFVTASGTCQLCTVTGCVTCTAVSTCTLCDTSLNYVLSSPTCLLCDSTTNMFADPNTQTCQSCNLTNCLNCSSLTTCSICDLSSLYYLGPSQTCLLCDPTLNYFFDPVTLDCNLCTLSQCVTCTNLTACTTCNTTNDYTVNPSTMTCQVCTLVGCVNCTDIYTCSQCNLTGNYILTVNNTCQLCTGGLFANATSQACQVCTMTQCTLCSSLTSCITCNTSNAFYLLPNLTCSYCDHTLNDFINMTTLDCQTCSLTQCLNCSSLTVCSACNETAQYFLNTATGLCQACATVLVGCVDCQNFSSCITCESVGYFISLQNTCTPICGDGLVRSYEQCDDGNLIADDGCSPTCTIQIGYICTSQPSTCVINNTALQNHFGSIQRSGCNSFKLTTKKPEYPYNKFPQSVTSMTDGITINSVAQNDTHFTITADYTKDIASENIVIGYTPGIPIAVQYNPVVPALYYTSSQCQKSEEMKSLFIAVEVISYAILIVSIISCKIVGLELFGVLQLSYFTLSSHSYLNIYLQPLTKFRSLNGLNVLFTNQSSTQLPTSLQTMQVNGNFINNFNIMFLLLIVELLVGLIIYIVAIKTRRQKLQKIGLRLMKQGFITLVLFNIFNISFSAGVHWKYASPDDAGYGGSCFVLYATLVAVIAAVFAMQLTGKEDYGEFKTKFKRVWICQLYIPLTIVYRMFLGFYIGYESEYQQSTLLILSCSIAFMMYTMVNLPFKNVYQNYRCSLVHFTMLFTLLTTNYYRSMKSTTPMGIKGKIYAPAIIELVLMMACICISFVVLVYEIYFIVKEWWQKKKIDGDAEKNSDNQPINPNQQNHQTHENIQTNQNVDKDAADQQKVESQQEIQIEQNQDEASFAKIK